MREHHILFSKIEYLISLFNWNSSYRCIHCTKNSWVNNLQCLCLENIHNKCTIMNIVCYLFKATLWTGQNDRHTNHMRINKNHYNMYQSVATLDGTVYKLLRIIKNSQIPVSFPPIFFIISTFWHLHHKIKSERFQTVANCLKLS